MFQKPLKAAVRGLFVHTLPTLSNQSIELARNFSRVSRQKLVAGAVLVMLPVFGAFRASLQHTNQRLVNGGLAYNAGAMMYNSAALLTNILIACPPIVRSLFRLPRSLLLPLIVLLAILLVMIWISLLLALRLVTMVLLLGLSVVCFLARLAYSTFAWTWR